MNILLLFFALPIATIIISIALQKIFKNPFLVAAIVFAIFLVVTFIINDLNFLVATIVYTLISLITAFFVCIICKYLRNMNEEESDENSNSNCNNIGETQIINNNTESNVLGLTDGINYNGCNNRNINNYELDRNINVYPNISTRSNTRCYKGRRII